MVVMVMMLVMMMVMMMMIKRKKIYIKWYTPDPTERLLLNSGYLSPQLDKGMLASPCVLVQGSLLMVSPSPDVPGWALHLPRVWCQEPVYHFTSRKPPRVSLRTWSPSLLPSSCWAAEISLCKTDIELPWKVHSLGQMQQNVPLQEDDQGVNPLWLKANPTVWGLCLTIV